MVGKHMTARIKAGVRSEFLRQFLLKTSSDNNSQCFSKENQKKSQDEIHRE
jgi:hypothetical protein